MLAFADSILRGGDFSFRGEDAALFRNQIGADLSNSTHLILMALFHLVEFMQQLSPNQFFSIWISLTLSD